MCPSSIEELPPPPAGKQGFPWEVADVRLPDSLPAGKSWPRISVVTPSYNQGQFLEKALRSVLLQGYPNLEYFVIDGGSVDDSQEIIRRYQPWLTGWVSEPDSGQSEAINKGLSWASGEILHWLNADDYLLPGALQTAAGQFRQHPEAAAWVGRCRRVDPQGNTLSLVTPRQLTRAGIADWSRQGFFYQPACFFSAAAWQEVGPLDESLQIAMDLDLWMRLSDWGEFIPLQQVLAEAVVHPEAKTQRRRLAMQAETIHIQVKYGYLDTAAGYLQALQRGSRPGRLFRALIRRFRSSLPGRTSS
jgi:glycosyltransferase involved in cell wall biosynthesis